MTNSAPEARKEFCNVVIESLQHGMQLYQRKLKAHDREPDDQTTLNFQQPLRSLSGPFQSKPMAPESSLQLRDKHMTSLKNMHVRTCETRETCFLSN